MGLDLYRDGETVPYFSTSMAAGLILGSAALDTGANSGSAYVPEFADGLPFYWLDGGPQDKFPTVTISGTSITWSPHQDGAFYVGQIKWGIR